MANRGAAYAQQGSLTLLSDNPLYLLPIPLLPLDNHKNEGLLV